MKTTLTVNSYWSLINFQTNPYIVRAKKQRKKNVLLGTKWCPSVSFLPTLQIFISSLNHKANVLAHNFNIFLTSVYAFSSSLVNGCKHRSQTLTAWSWPCGSIVLLLLQHLTNYIMGKKKIVLFNSNSMSKLKLLLFRSKETPSTILENHTQN